MARRTRVRRRGRRRRSVGAVRRRRFAPRVYRRRRRRARRNPLFRSVRTGRFKGRAPGRRLHRRRRGPKAGTWHMNPRHRRRRARRNVTWEMFNPRHRRRRHGRRGRRRARRNPYHSNARRRVRLLSNPIEAAVEAFKDAFSGETLEMVFQTGVVGFGGTLVGSRVVYKRLITALDTPIGRPFTHLAVSILESLFMGYVGGSKWATRALTGGLIATAWQGASELIKSYAPEAGAWIPTLGDAESADFRQAIEQEMLREIRGGSSDEGMSIYLQPAGVNETYLQPAGAQAYLTQREAESAEMGAYLTKREVENVTGMGDVESEFGTRSLPERF